MKNILTKSLTSIALASAVALPIVVSNVYAASGYPQDQVNCNIEEQSSNRAQSYADACLKKEATAQIDSDVLQYASRVIKIYAEGKGSGPNGDKYNNDPRFVKAKGILYNKANIRDCKTWTFRYEANRQKCTNP